MVLEGIIQPFKAERRPIEIFGLGMLFSSVGALLGMFIFSPFSSIVCISLTSIVCVPLVYGVIKMEERKTLETKSEWAVIKEHGRALMFFIFLFLGFVVSFTLWYVFLPEAHMSELFSVQTATITEVQNMATGKVTDPVGEIGTLMIHNSRVLVFCLLFAFFYGFGAIFILTWNASVIGAAIGDMVRSNLESGFFTSVTSGLSKYLVHGIPEITAYFTAGLAGGIISIAVINHDFKSDSFRKILRDSLDLIVLSIGMLFVAAVLEVFVSPLI